MGNWSRKTSLEPIEFDGDTVVCEVNRLKVADMIKLSAKMKKNETSGRVELTFNDSMELLKIASELLPTYVTAINGLSMAGGTPMDIKTFHNEALTEFYFVELIGMILAGLMEVSSVNKENEKNLDAPS